MPVDSPYIVISVWGPTSIALQVLSLILL